MSIYFQAVSAQALSLADSTDYISFQDALIAKLRQTSADPQHLYIAGNGGSYASAQHIATDISTLYEKGLLSSTAFLTSSQSQMTRVSNDMSFAEVFIADLRPLLPFVKAVLAISVSGNSPNIVELLKYAQTSGIPTFSMLGFGGRGMAREYSDFCLAINSNDFRLVEDIHMIAMSSILDSLVNTCNG